MVGGGGEKNCPKKYNIDYFEVKFKLNIDEERGSKIEKKSQNSKKNRVKTLFCKWVAL